MSLSTFHSEIKLLFDKNVDKRLERFLKQKEIDVISKPKGFSDDKLAEISKLEQRILITNDDDFTKFSKERLFSVIWLRIPQRKIEPLKNAFIKLLDTLDLKDTDGKLIILYEDRFEILKLL